MRFDYVDPFVSTAMRVLAGALRTPVQRGDVSLTPDGRISGDVAIVVRILGDPEGNIILTMNTETALGACSALIGAECGSLTPLGMDALSELANMITGNAVSALNDLGFDFTVLPPLVIDNASTDGNMARIEALRIPLQTLCGEVIVNVALGAEQN